MTAVEVIVPRQPRRWQARIVERLQAAGHEVGVTAAAAQSSWPAAAGALMALERQVLGQDAGHLGDAVEMQVSSLPAPELRLDLTGEARPSHLPTLSAQPATATLVATLAAGQLPDIVLVLDGRLVARAAPMVDDRVFIARGLNDVLARLVTLTVAAVNRWPDVGTTADPLTPSATAGSFLGAYLRHGMPRLMHEARRRITHRYAHWRVGYRFVDGSGVAEEKRLGRGWSVLPDDGTSFYADPFAFADAEGRHFIFVEDYAHTLGRASISVSEVDRQGRAGAPRPVIEAPHHLSYPQVYKDAGDVWMIPESVSAGVVLYRAVAFPDRWEQVAVLAGPGLSDATLLRHDGRYWLFATDRDGDGSTSDTLVVLHARELGGPWTPHRRNPVLIDRRRARPGGAFVRIGDRWVLPVQDGTLGYGGGLGLSELTRLDLDEVELAAPVPVSAEGDFPYPQIHTLNRAGRLEVIDGIVPMRRRRRGPGQRRGASSRSS